MPATRQALTLEQEYGRQVGRLWREVQAIILRQFEAVDVDDLEAAFRRFVTGAAPLIALGQQQAQRLAQGFLEDYVELEARRAFRAEPIGAGIAGTTRDGARIRIALTGAVGLAWRALGQGRPTSVALSTARAQVARVTSQAVSDAADRELEHQAERSPIRVVLEGWTWVAVGATCPACLSRQNGYVRPWSEQAGRHPGCDCQRVPAIKGIRETVERPTGDEIFRSLPRPQQEAMFKNAGADKAALIRSGEASLADFVARDRTAAGTVITEAPLEAVV